MSQLYYNYGHPYITTEDINRPVQHRRHHYLRHVCLYFWLPMYVLYIFGINKQQAHQRERKRRRLTVIFMDENNIKRMDLINGIIWTLNRCETQ